MLQKTYRIVCVWPIQCWLKKIVEYLRGKSCSLPAESVEICTWGYFWALNSKIAGSKPFSHGIRLKIQDVRPKMCFFLYNSICIVFKPHKCIEVEYKVGHCGHFGAMCMSVSITVLEIQHVGTFADLLK